MRPGDEELKTFDGLRRVVAILRGPQGCPWDRAQTHRSLRHYLREEAMEAMEAIEADDPKQLAEELGDLLLQVLMHTHMAEEAGTFTLEDVIYGIATKLIRRHPHVFGGRHLQSPQEVLEQWEELKRQEKGENAHLLDGVPRALPALAQAQALWRRLARLGIGPQSAEEAKQEVLQALQGLAAALTTHERHQRLGHAAMALAALASILEVDAEDALLDACHALRRRARRAEELARRQGTTIQELSLEGRRRIWQAAGAEWDP
jgi:tetrapyrrole methylase family protein/MazG family protein